MNPLSNTSNRTRYLTLTAALLGWTLDGIEMGVFPVIARPALRELLEFTDIENRIRQWNGALAIAFLLGAAIGGFVFGRLGDRLGRVRALTLSMLVYSLLTGLSALALSPIQLVILRFFAAMGMGGEWALGVALVVETWPNWARPWLAGAIGAAVNVGYILVAMLSWFIDPMEWRTILAWCAAPAALTFFVRRFVPESEQWKSVAKSQVTPTWKRNALIGAIAVAPYLLTVWGAVQVTQLWAQSLTGEPRAGITVQLVSAAAAILGSLFAPLLLDRMSRRWSYALLSAAALVAAQSLFLLTRDFNGFCFFNVALVGFTSGAFGGWFALYLPELFPSAARATGQGISYNSGRILAAVGVAATTWTAFPNGDYPIIGAIVALSYLGGMILAPWLPETSGRPLE